MTEREWISLAGVLAACAAFASGLWQYAKAQRWKRAEFVAAEIKAFESDELVAKALLMLDYNRRRINLLPESYESEPANRVVSVNDADLTSALVHHSLRRPGFTPKEVVIRDCFDRLLDRLERFESYIEAGLISAKELKPYLGYWIEIIANRESKRKPQDFYTSLWSYIDEYDFHGVQRLARRFDRDITPTSEGRESA